MLKSGLGKGEALSWRNRRVPKSSPAGIDGGEGRLRMHGLVKSYGATPAVDNVDLDVESGEFFALLGPSGSGKTTIIMMVAGFVIPDDGEIDLDGIALDGIPIEKRGIGVVFQNYALFPHMTVAENIAFPLQTRGMPRAEVTENVEWVLDLVGLREHIDKYPSQMSGGQQQRTAVARALVFRPSVLLMDEPLGALDKNLRARLQLELRKIQRELNITTVYVTHDQEEAFALADRVAVMRDGRVEQLATPRQLYSEPSSLFVANFVGDSNTVKGKVLEVGERAVVEAEGWGTVGARAVQLTTGTDAVISFRPERVTFIDPESALRDDGDATSRNITSGEVVETVFAGPVEKYWVQLADDVTVQVRVTNIGEATRPVVGDTVWISCAVDDVLVFAADGAATDDPERD